jgi:hypothetical protein
MERVPLHSWEMEFSIQYHVTINSQLNGLEFNKVLYKAISYISDSHSRDKNSKMELAFLTPPFLG